MILPKERAAAMVKSEINAIVSLAFTGKTSFCKP
jgi:hypothetical protein